VTTRRAALARPKLAPETDIVRWLEALPPGDRPAALARLGEAELDSLDRDWPGWAHEGQLPPPESPGESAANAGPRDVGPWRTWVIMAGRGFGKTLAGAQWIAAAVAASSSPSRLREGAKGGPVRLSIALVGATLDEARRVMVEGRSGLLAVAGAWIDEWSPSLRRLRFTTGAEAILFSGASPEQSAAPSIISPGATSSPNGRSRRRPGTCSSSACAAAIVPAPSSRPPRAPARS
jgi:hypothetical protein